MRWKLPFVLAWTAVAAIVPVPFGRAAAEPAEEAAKTVVVVFDFTGEGELGKKLADSVRLTLARNAGKQFEVIDQLTTQESSQPTGADAKVKDVTALMKEQFSAAVGIMGSAKREGGGLSVEIRCIDLRPGAKDGGWTQTFSDGSERAAAVISRAIGEKVTGGALWKPPETGDLKEPTNFGKPENLNGNFENGSTGWAKPDNVSTFLEKGPAGRGMVLRMKNDLARDPWLEYRRDLMFNKASPNNPPKIAQDTTYGGLAGMEGADYISEHFKATPGQRYWLTLDTKGVNSAKVFIKGWKRAVAAEDGLSETALKELRITPEAFARMTEAERKKLIDADIKKNPKRYLSQCWDWHMNLKGDKEWTHHALWFPPRGGLPKDVELLTIKILTIWPPGETLYDNVYVYKDPNQKGALDEEKSRTPNAGKTSDKIPD